MATTLGTKLGTMLGTELADMVDPGPVLPFDATKLYALSVGTGNYFDSQAGGGEVGDATTGFGAIYVLQVVSVPATTTQIIFNNTPTASPFAGHTLQAASTGVLRGTAYRDITNNVISPSRSITSSDIGRVLVFGYAFDPGASRLRAYADRQEVGTATTMATYLPGTLSSRLGVYRDGTLPTTSFRVLGWVTYRGVLSSPNLLALFDAIRAAQDVPTSITGVTVTHRWSVRDTLATAGVAVADGAAAPATIPDSVTSASVDAMAKVGSPVVRVIDPATPQLWSYEATPIAYGTSGLTATAFYENTTVGIMPGSTSGFWAAASFIADTQGTGSTRTLFGSANGANGGWDLRTTNHTTATMTFLDDTGAGRSTPLATIASTDLGKVLLLLCVYDAAALKGRTYWKRAEVATGTTVTGYRPSNVGMRLGNHTLGGASPNTTILGAAYGLGVPTLAQVQALFDAVAANDGRIQVGIPGMTTSLYDLTLDASGGTIGAGITDRVGSVHLTRAGTPTTTARYSRAFAW